LACRISRVGLLDPIMSCWLEYVRTAAVAGCLLVVTTPLPLAAGEHPPVTPKIALFLRQHCLDCHAGGAGEAGLDLEAVLAAGLDPANPHGDRVWARIIDRVAAGEMPPAEAEQPSPAPRDCFVSESSDWLRTTQRLRQAAFGRVRGRRLTRLQIERSLHDLLAIDIPLAEQLPAEGRPRGFTTVAEWQAVSHHHLASHLQVVDLALDEAFGRALLKQQPHCCDLDPVAICRKNPKARCREPELREGRAVIWSCSMPYYGRIPATTAPVDGWYRFRLHGSGIKLPASGGVWTAVHSGQCVSTAPILEPVISFEAAAEPRVIEFETWLPRGHMLEVRPQDLTIKRASFKGGQVGTGEGEPQDVPGVAIDRLEMEQVHRYDLAQLREQLFGGLPLLAGPDGILKPMPTQPVQAITALIHDFASRAFRREVEQTEVAEVASLATRLLADGQSFTAALRASYRAVLCHPEFCYFTERPGPLDQAAIATRLAFFLTAAPPDQPLQSLAHTGQLHDPAVLRAEVDRLLGQATAGPAPAAVVGRKLPARQFIEDFAAEWLDLDQIDFTQPDRKLSRGFDPIVRMAMPEETHAFLTEMLCDDRPVSELIDARHSFLNSRLARFYGIEDVQGDALRRVDLPAGSHRGGLLTQAAVLKVTANGSTTSPVVRGAWVAERLLGVTIPPPPAGVSAIEPDIRGATTIREQLEQHRSDAGCASCHRLMDPYGFALESFDPAGQWRDRYQVLVSGKRKSGPLVEPGDQLPDGRSFANADELKQLLAADTDRLNRAVAGHLLVYGTGAELTFADRQAVAAVAAEAEAAGGGLRSLLKAVVASPVFLSK
jgi:hypothetical protein